MNKHLIGILMGLLIPLTSLAENKITVLDKEDSSPVVSATVFSNSGAIIGLTDKFGVISIPNDNDYPLLVRCLGYEAQYCDSDKHVVNLLHDTYSLKELVVTPVDRPVMRIICYVRQYTSVKTGTYTFTGYSEHMADYFITEKKVKGFKQSTSPRFLSSRLYSKISNDEGLDSVFKPKYNNDVFSLEDIIEIPKETKSLGDNIKNGANIDSTMGKYRIKNVIKKNGDLFISKTDHLADIKDHSFSPFAFKMLGFTLDVLEWQEDWIINPKPNYEYTAADIISGVVSFKILGRGRWIKKAFHTENPVNIYCTFEIYPVDIQYCTVAEAKKLQKNPDRIKFKTSPDAAPLSPAAQELVDRLSKK